MTCTDDYIRILDVDCFVRYLQFEQYYSARAFVRGDLCLSYHISLGDMHIHRRCKQNNVRHNYAKIT